MVRESLEMMHGVPQQQHGQLPPPERVTPEWREGATARMALCKIMLTLAKAAPQAFAPHLEELAGQVREGGGCLFTSFSERCYCRHWVSVSATSQLSWPRQAGGMSRPDPQSFWQGRLLPFAIFMSVAVPPLIPNGGDVSGSGYQISQISKCCVCCRRAAQVQQLWDAGRIREGERVCLCEGTPPLLQLLRTVACLLSLHVLLDPFPRVLRLDFYT